MTQGQARPPMVFDRAFLTGVEGITELIFLFATASNTSPIRAQALSGKPSTRP